MVLSQPRHDRDHVIVVQLRAGPGPIDDWGKSQPTRSAGSAHEVERRAYGLNSYSRSPVTIAIMLLSFSYGLGMGWAR